MRTTSSAVILAVILLAAGLSACSGPQAPQPELKVADQPFVSGGTIDMQLSGGAYSIRPSADDHIRITFPVSPGNPSKAGLTIDKTSAKLTVEDTPKNNFNATIEVPKATDLVIRLSGGNLEMAPITGNKDIETGGGNVQISVGDPNDYASVDASVKAGSLDSGPFGESRSGLLQNLNWSGRGKYKLHVQLGAGNLELRAK
jgi:hypothetical protein